MNRHKASQHRTWVLTGLVAGLGFPLCSVAAGVFGGASEPPARKADVEMLTPEDTTSATAMVAPGLDPARPIQVHLEFRVPSHARVCAQYGGFHTIGVRSGGEFPHPIESRCVQASQAGHVTDVVLIARTDVPTPGPHVVADGYLVAMVEVNDKTHVFKFTSPYFVRGNVVTK